MLLDRFGRDQHELLIKQLFHIKQMGSVSDYIDKFAGLMDQLAAYESAFEPLHYTMKFIDGLRDDLRASVLIQHPSDLDTAYVLAQLQEEVSLPPKKREFRQSDFSSSYKFEPSLAVNTKDKVPTPVFDDWRSLEASKPKSVEDPWSALRAMRRAQGLCQCCAEKWSKDHRFSNKVQLHAVEEVLEVFMMEDEFSYDDATSTSQVFLSLSESAVSGVAAARTLCLKGMIQGHCISILVDSGSSNTFISKVLAEKLSGQSLLSTPLQVRVPHGNLLSCDAEFRQAVWSTCGYEFHFDLKILPLSSYDMILGLDWLESFSPMQVHWKQKWMAIPYHNSTIILYESLPNLPVGTMIQLCSVDVKVQDSVSVVFPAEVQRLIHDFVVLFEVPVDLPPSRSCDHSIPLVDGASRVNMRSYRYPPVLKYEIEKQVGEMLKNGLIQPSNSPFSSSVLLVKKKDNSWRFCVDYRFLNAITLKGKFPIPIIDEFLDEPGHASWFSSLDLRAGFHQIGLKPGEEHKTTFQTHFGQFEFRVMPFGLTGAPGTFQVAMNTTLAPYLRKFVLVFFDDILIYNNTFEDHLQHIRLVFELLAKDPWNI
jgi:hypothetical protein